MGLFLHEHSDDDAGSTAQPRGRRHHSRAVAPPPRPISRSSSWPALRRRLRRRRPKSPTIGGATIGSGGLKPIAGVVGIDGARRNRIETSQRNVGQRDPDEKVARGLPQCDVDIAAACVSAWCCRKCGNVYFLALVFIGRFFARCRKCGTMHARHIGTGEGADALATPALSSPHSPAARSTLATPSWLSLWPFAVMAAAIARRLLPRFRIAAIRLIAACSASSGTSSLSSPMR